MSDTILAAIINAVASILIAIVSKSTVSKRTRTETTSSIGLRGWLFALALLLVWLFISPALIHHDLAGNNFFLIPFVTLLLAIFAPIPPLTAGWLTLAVYAANFFVGPISNRLAGSSYDTGFLVDSLDILLLMSFGNAVIAGLITYLRLGLKPGAMPPQAAQSAEQVPASEQDIPVAAELEELGELHKTGVLSDEEFRRAKERVLGETRPNEDQRSSS